MKTGTTTSKTTAKALLTIVLATAYTLLRLLSFLCLKFLNRLPVETVAFYCRDWSNKLLRYAHIDVKVTGAPISREPCLLVGNHVSYLDIPVIMSQVYARFVSKKEVALWPVFGQAATAVGTIFVDRSSYESRKTVAQTIANAVEKRDRNICLFPEGTSKIWGNPWKKGSLQIAQRLNFPVQAFVLKYYPIWEMAYIDDDTLIVHMWRMLKRPKLTVEIEFRAPQLIQDAASDCLEIQKWVHGRMREFLLGHGFDPRAHDRESGKRLIAEGVPIEDQTLRRGDASS